MEGKMEGKKEGRKEGKKDGKKERQRSEKRPTYCGPRFSSVISFHRLSCCRRCQIKIRWRKRREEWPTGLAVIYCCFDSRLL